MKKIITFLYLLILAYACYDDKGNYDYREINQISIQNIDSLVLCDQMDLLSIPVGGNAVFGFKPVYLYVGSQPEGCGDDERSECIC